MERLLVTFLVFAGCHGSGNYTAVQVSRDTSTPRQPPKAGPPPIANKTDAGSDATPRGPTREACNGEDDDQDGTVDEGCACAYRGKPGKVCSSTVAPDGECRRPEAFEPEETFCDNLDNDCDGKIDETCRYQTCFIREGCEITSARRPRERLIVEAQCEEENLVISVTEEWIVGSSGRCWIVECVGDDGLAEICKPEVGDE